MNLSEETKISPIVVTVFLTSFVAATFAFATYLFSSLVPEIRSELSIGQNTVGLASGAAQAGNMVFAIVAGLLVPRIGPIRVIYFFLVVTILCQGVFYSMSNVDLMVTILFIMGGCGAAVWVAIVVATQTLIPDRHRALALGLMCSGTSFGLFLNGLIVPYILDHWGWRSAWLALGGVTIALTLVSLLFLYPILSMRGRSDAKTSEKNTYWSSLLNPAAVFSVLLLFGTAMSMVPYQTYLTSLLRENSNWTAADASRAWSAIGTGGMVGGILLGLLQTEYLSGGRSFSPTCFWWSQCPSRCTWQTCR
ncbi:MFS transporter [Bradyrhizobium sp. USDA 3256]